jgi:hypothetical protein
MVIYDYFYRFTAPEIIRAWEYIQDSSGVITMANVSLSSLYWIVASVNPIPSYSLFFCAVESFKRHCIHRNLGESISSHTVETFIFLSLPLKKRSILHVGKKGLSLFLWHQPGNSEWRKSKRGGTTSIAFFHRFNFRRISVHSLMSPAFNIHTDVYRLCRVDASAIIGVAQFLSYRRQLILARARVFQNLNTTDISRVKRLRVTGS